MAENEVFGWDSAIEEDGNGGEYEIVPEGNYRFTVIGFERGMHEGSPKIPPCPKAVLTFEIEGPNGPARCTRNLFVCKHMERMLSDFFRCIGQKKRGEKLTPNWDAVIGSRGMAHFRPSKYKDREYNDCAYFIDADDPRMIEVNDPNTPDNW